MKPAARIQTTIEIWHSLWHDEKSLALPMDKCLQDYFRARRFIGSKDRRDISDRLYGIMRHYARLSWWLERLGGNKDDARQMVIAYERLCGGLDSAALSDHFDGTQYSPAPLSDAEKDLSDQLEGPLTHSEMNEATAAECPDWAYPALKEFFGDSFAKEMIAMQHSAPLHIRINSRITNADQVKHSLEKEGIESEKGLISPFALRLTSAANLTQTNAYQKGWIDVQDEGSQAIALACAAQPGIQILDYCAGGGGKTLALGDIMDGKGRIVAMDNDTRRLMRGKKRYISADIHNVELRSLEEDRHRKWIKRQNEKFDVVLVDAPCSGTGTWRRNPDMRWRSAHQPNLDDTLALQAKILDRVGAYVKRGGALIYATCSLLPQENEAQIERFLSAHPDFTIEPLAPILNLKGTDTPLTTDQGFMRLSPARHGTDGFFAARLIKK